MGRDTVELLGATRATLILLRIGLIVGLVFFLLGLLWPRALQPVFAAWMRLALALPKGLTR